MNILDRAIGFFNPQAGFKRVQARAQMLSMDSQVRKYEGAAQGRRYSGWKANKNPSVNQLINKELKTLVARSRDLSINNPYARKAPVTIANNVVGTGIIPTPIVRRKTKEGKVVAVKSNSLKQHIQAVKDAWQDWALNINCDYDSNYGFYGLQHLAMRTIVVSGEVLFIKKSVSTDVNPYGLQLLVLEGDYIDKFRYSDRDSDGGYILHGVKFDKFNKRTGYYIYDRHPSEGNAVSSFVPIGDIIHVYDVERAGQTRGVPSAASTILKQRDLDDYEDAELLGKKAAACMPIFVQNATPEAQTNHDPVEAIEPGAINYLNAGETVTFATPPANNGFSDFTKTQHRAIAAGYFLTYEQLTGDLSNVTFSSARMGVVEFVRMVEFWQYSMLIPKLCDTVFKWFVERVKIMQSLSPEIEVTATWTAPRRIMVNPQQEVKALKDEVRAGFSSWTEAVKSNGYNPDDVIEQLKEDQKKFQEAGLVMEWNPLFAQQAQLNLQKAKTQPATEDRPEE